MGGNKLWDKKDLDAAVDGCKKSAIGETQAMTTTNGAMS